MPSFQKINRRQTLRQIIWGGLGLGISSGRCEHFQSVSTKKLHPGKCVAGILTWYTQGSHADVIIGKILEGWAYDGGPGPKLRLASLYIDQFPDKDMGRRIAEKHGIPIFNTIEDALTLESGTISVDGVLSIGEHGDYPWNDKQQKLYPRRRFFDAITRTFQKYNKVVPVFNDKHLGPVWEDAHWMYERAKQLNIPFMAGSSLPVSFRKPEVNLSMGSRVLSAVGVGYSGLDIYGIHTLETYQSFVERRHGGEKGVKSVQWFGPDTMWSQVDSGKVDRSVLDAAIAATPANHPKHLLRETKGDGVGLFLFEYLDGLTGAVFMLPGYLAGCGIAIKTAQPRRILATSIEERREPHYPHFAYLLKAIESMILTGKPSYPVERTLLTSGILDRALNSRFHGGKKYITPELNISYSPVDYPHAPEPPLYPPFNRP
jgi:hypothetical protein